MKENEAAAGNLHLLRMVKCNRNGNLRGWRQRNWQKPVGISAAVFEDETRRNRRGRAAHRHIVRKNIKETSASAITSKKGCWKTEVAAETSTQSSGLLTRE